MKIFTLIFIFCISLYSFELSSKSVIVSENKKVAKELKKYIDKIFDCDCKIADKKGDNFILLKSDSSLSDDAFFIRFSKKSLTIRAKNERGLFYGSYYFLENYLGCMFLTKDVEIIPRCKRVRFKNKQIKRVPRFSYREIFSNTSEDMGFATKLALNGRLGHRAWQKDENYPKLRRIFNDFSSKKLLGDKYECNGQYDFSNEDAKKLALKNLHEKLKDIDVDYDDYVYLQHEDRGSFCGKREDFLEYALYLSKDFDKNFLFEAYQWSAVTHKSDVVFNKNLSVFFSTIELNFAKPITAKENRIYFNNLKKYNSYNTDIIIWHYVANFGGYLQPIPNIFSTASSIKSFSKLKNVSGVFLQGGYDCKASELDELKTWVFAKLLWESELDVDMLVKRFCDGYYKEASKYVQKYIKALDILSRRLDRKIFVKTSVELKYFKKKYIDYLESILDRAYLCSCDDKVKERVLKLYSGIDYVRVIKGVASKKVRDRFEKFLKKYDIENYAEGRSVEGLYEILKIERKPSSVPTVAKGLVKGKDWFEYQEYALKLCCTKYAKDKKSSDGVSAYMDGDKSDWGFQLDILSLPKGKWDIYASVKIEKSDSLTSHVLPAVHYGVEPSSKGVYFLAQFKDKVYKDIKIATINTLKSSDDYVWLSPAGNNGEKKVYVDRFFIVRVK